jgi:hypothetical protein
MRCARLKAATKCPTPAVVQPHMLTHMPVLLLKVYVCIGENLARLVRVLVCPWSFLSADTVATGATVDPTCRRSIFLQQNQPDAPMSQTYFIWSNTLHVSDGLSVRHQDFKTVHTATGICQTDTADCLLAGTQDQDGTVLILLASCQQTCVTYTIAVCAVINIYKYTMMYKPNTTKLYYCIRATCFDSYRIIFRTF